MLSWRDSMMQTEIRQDQRHEAEQYRMLRQANLRPQGLLARVQETTERWLRQEYRRIRRAMGGSAPAGQCQPGYSVSCNS